MKAGVGAEIARAGIVTVGVAAIVAATADAAAVTVAETAKAASSAASGWTSRRSNALHLVRMLRRVDWQRSARFDFWQAPF